MGITAKQNDIMDKAFEYFNKHLFGNRLPDTMIIFNRKPRSRGYIAYDRLKERDGSSRITEIALNPDCFVDRSDIEILSTLAHEMVHLLRSVDGEQSKRNYHSKEWADEMKAIGLQPSSTGEPGGKETGQSMTHYIVDGGLFEKTAGAFLLGGKKVLFESPPIPSAERASKAKTRNKYTCPECGLSAWAKPQAKLACGECKEMLEEETD